MTCRPVHDTLRLLNNTGQTSLKVQPNFAQTLILLHWNLKSETKWCYVMDTLRLICGSYMSCLWICCEVFAENSKNVCTSLCMNLLNSCLCSRSTDKNKLLVTCSIRRGPSTIGETQTQTNTHIHTQTDTNRHEQTHTHTHTCTHTQTRLAM